MVSILKNIATAATAAAAATQSQEAEAVSVGRLVRLGFLDNQSAQNPRAVKGAFTKYNKAREQSSGFNYRESLSEAGMDETVFTPTDLGARKQVNLESLVGRPIVPVRGDQSNLGVLHKLGGIDIPNGSPVEAGNKFSQQHAETGRGWMSMSGVAKGQQDKIIKAAEDTGEIPVGVYNSMKDTTADFSTAVAQPMMAQIPILKIAKKDKKEFDDELRRVFPSWVGLDSPDAMDQLLGRNGFANIGANRTRFSNMMGKSKYRNKGFPSYSEILPAINDPDLAGVPLGTSGLSMYDAILTPAYKDIGVHQSYDTVMAGKYIGGSGNVPFDVMFPKLNKRFSASMTGENAPIKGEPRPLNQSEIIDAANKRKDGYEIADQQWLDGVSEFIERNKKAGGTLLTGSGVAGANASEDSSVINDIQAGIDFADFEREQNTLPNRIKNYLSSPSDANVAIYDDMRRRGEDTIEPNRSPRATNIANFIDQYSPDVPILGQFIGSGISDQLRELGYNKTKGKVLGQSAMSALDIADIAGAGILLKNAGKQAVTRGGKTMYHGTNAGKDFDRIDPSKLQGRDAGFLGKGFYSGDPVIASRYAKNMEGGNVQPVETAAGKYKNYTLEDKQKLGMAVKKDPSLSEMLTQQNTSDGYIGARVLDGKGNVVEQVNYFPTRDVDNAITPFSF